MTYLTIKIIKGNPYLYEVRSEREGDRVSQKFVRYFGRADRADNIARQAGREIPVSVEPERAALPVVTEPEAVAPAVEPEVVKIKPQISKDIYEEGDIIESNKPVTIDYLRNLEKSPDMGERFAQHIEPKGEYMNFNSRPNKDVPDYGKFESGRITFNKPLVLEHKTTAVGGWKTDLSNMFGGKKGKVLTNAIKKAGYDGIITTEVAKDNDGTEKLITAEIVNIDGTKTLPTAIVTPEAITPPIAPEATPPSEPERILPEVTPAVEGEAPDVTPEESLILYHGTDATFDISEFKEKGTGVTTTTFGQVETERHGIFLSESQEFASEYGENVTPLNVNVKNIAEVNTGDNPSPVVRGFIDSLDPFSSDRDLWLLAKNLKSGWAFFDGEIGARFTEYLKEQGYDSASFEEILPSESTKTGQEVEGRTVVVLDAKNIQQPLHKDEVTPEVATPPVATEIKPPTELSFEKQLEGNLRVAMEQPERLGIPPVTPPAIEGVAPVSEVPVTPEVKGIIRGSPELEIPKVFSGEKPVYVVETGEYIPPNWKQKLMELENVPFKGGVVYFLQGNEDIAKKFIAEVEEIASGIQAGTITNKEAAIRYGKILGYSDKDIGFFLSESKQISVATAKKNLLRVGDEYTLDDIPELIKMALSQGKEGILITKTSGETFEIPIKLKPTPPVTPEVTPPVTERVKPEPTTQKAEQSPSEPKVVWVDSWKDIVKSVLEEGEELSEEVVAEYEEIYGGASPSEGLDASYNKDTDTIYAVRGKATDFDVEHEKYHALRVREGSLPTSKQNPKDFVDEELMADKYAYDKIGHFDDDYGYHIGGIIYDLTRGSYRLNPVKAMDTVRGKLEEINAPPEMFTAYKQIESKAIEDTGTDEWDRLRKIKIPKGAWDRANAKGISYIDFVRGLALKDSPKLTKASVTPEPVITSEPEVVTPKVTPTPTPERIPKTAKVDNYDLVERIWEAKNYSTKKLAKHYNIPVNKMYKILSKLEDKGILYGWHFSGEGRGRTGENLKSLEWTINTDKQSDVGGTIDELKEFFDENISKLKPEKTTEIPYSRDLDIRNVEALPKGTGAKYLVTLKGQGDELIAKKWARVKPKSLLPDEVLIEMPPPKAHKDNPT